MSKVMRDCFVFSSLRSVIGTKDLCLALDQSDAKLKPVLTWSRAFYRALGSLVVCTMSSHCLLKEFTFILLGSCDFFGFAFTTLNGKYFTSYLFSFTFELKPDEHCKLCNSVVMNQKISWIEVQGDFNS